MQKYEDAIQILENAHGVTAKYTASEYSTQALLKASTTCLLSSEEDDRISISLGKEIEELELSEEIQVIQKSMGLSLCVSIDDEETDDASQPVSIQPSCGIKRIAGHILDESLSKRTKKEELAHDVRDSSLLASDSEDEDEEKHGDQQESSEVWPSVAKESEMPPKGLDDNSPVEIFDQELIFSVSRNASEKAHDDLPSDCPSLGSTTSFDSSLSLDRETTYYRGGTRMCPPGSPEGPARRVTFSPSPPQIREFERYDMERKQLSSPDDDTIIEFNNLNKKCRMLKKNLDELNSFGVKTAIPVQRTQIVTRFAKQVGMSLLLMNAFILTQRR
jgi:hypothetical protein